VTRQEVFAHEFVDHIPEELVEGFVFVSMAYATAAHKCACGCGNEVITPLTPTDWQLIFDGESISLRPSIGNWNFPCQSHYWLDRNRVRWAPRWTRKQIEAGRARDRLAKLRAGGMRASADIAAATSPPTASLWERLRAWSRRLGR
jgi:hypothetical protein